MKQKSNWRFTQPKVKPLAGFTIIELLVVIAIIAILSAIVIANISDSRARARDTQRIAELHQIELALEQYKQVHGFYPCEDSTDADCSGQSTDANGIVGEGSGLDTLLAPYLGSIPVDPLGPGDSTYRYYYDGYQSCGGQSVQAVISAIEMERENNSNENDTICTSWGGEGGVGSSNSYNIVLGDSSG